MPAPIAAFLVLLGHRPEQKLLVIDVSLLRHLEVSGVERFYPPSIPRNAIADKAVVPLPKYV
jgi:hypothetical protein